MDRKKLGGLGEKIAEDFLRKKGYKILAKNYSSNLVSGPQRGEIDLVAKIGEVICFVEVKTLLAPLERSSPLIGFSGDGFLAEDKVDWLKQRKLVKTAEAWLAKNRIPSDSPWQIDVVTVQVEPAGKKARVRHFRNAAADI